jgi:hypothetical protein
VLDAAIAMFSPQYRETLVLRELRGISYIGTVTSASSVRGVISSETWRNTARSACNS